MSKRIPRTPFERLPAELAEALRPRVERLGYLGEFFQVAAQQPRVLRSFVQLTDDLKDALPDDLTEVVALTVAALCGNDYERHQHERLCRKLGLGDEWVGAVLALSPDEQEALSPPQRAAQALAMALVQRRGRDTAGELEAMVAAAGAEQAVAVLLLAGRYVTHSLFVNALELAPPVPSIFAERPASRRPPPWISEAEVRARLTLEDAIAALEEGLRREARGEAENMVKTHASWDAGTLHAIGAVFPAEGFAGTKTWAHTGRGAQPLFSLFDAGDGALLACIEAFALGQLRTGGISGVATRWLAAEDADDLALVGSGKQAMMQVRAVAAVRPLRRVRVFSPTVEHRAACAARVRRQLGVEVLEAGSVAEAVAGAPIVTLVTRAREPFLRADMVARGAHVNAVGAITPERRELERGLLARCDLVVADSVPAVRKLSSELRDHQPVHPLCEVVAAGRSRPAGADVTLFKAMGTGVSDLSLALEVWRRLHP